MSAKLKRLLPLAALCAAILAPVSPASAASSCAGSGYLCFYDYQTAQYGNVAGDNKYWSKLTGNWASRADWFYNQGNSMHVCVFYGDAYTNIPMWIQRGKTASQTNWGRSNFWTKLTACW